MIYDWLQKIEFAYPWLLPALLSLPVIAWLRHRMRRGLQAAVPVSAARLFTTRGGRAGWVHLPFWLHLLALGFLILAIARPQIRNVSSRARGEGIDIVLCMDVSGSMLSADFYPNRLEVAKEMAISFVQARQVDRIGLVIFSGESYTLYPVASDRTSLTEQIRGLRSGMLEDGTLIGEGLATSVDRLRGSTAKSRVIVLLTDGKEQPPENRLIDPATALNIAKTAGVKVYTIGMSAGGEATVLEKGATGKVGTGGLDEALLRRIATETGGEYFRAVDKESLQSIYARIDKLERSQVEVSTRTRYEEQFRWPLSIALLLLLLALLLRNTILRTFP
jgi:Ca-activated chloride channel family protein